MTIINQKSISGITSITFASAGDDLLTFHSNNGTERFRIDNSGNTKITAGIVTTLTVTGTTTLNGNLDLQDDDKILVGTGDDLEIYHDGSNSYVYDSGTGELRLNSDNAVRIRKHDNETMALFTANGASELYYDNSKKLETTSDGLTITGTATATEGLVLDGQTGSGKGLRLDLAGSGDYVIQETTTDDVVQFGGTGASNFFVHNISTGNISIGTTTGTGNLNVAGTGDCAIDLIADIDNNGSNQWPVINFRRHSATGTPVSRIYQVESHGGLVFDNNGSERLRILSSGGLTFNGDSATANALDDYEEGTFSPGIAFGGNAVGVTYAVAQGFYTKIGKVVHCNGNMTLSNAGSSTGGVTLTGLPFTVDDNLANTSLEGGGLFMYQNGMSGTTYGSMTILGNNGTTSASVYRASATNGEMSGASKSNIDNDFDCRFMITYYV